TYRRHADAVHVLRGVDLDVRPGDFVSVLGASGSGKSTLLHLLGLLDAPDRGRITLEGRRIDSLPRRERDGLRNGTFGFIFQFYHLLPELTTLENVLAPALIRYSCRDWWGERATLRRRAADLLERGGLGHRLRPRPRGARRGGEAGGGDRPGPGHPAADHPRRRADRQPGRRQRGPDHGAAPRLEPPRGGHYRDGDAQPRPRRRHRPHGAADGRAGGARRAPGAAGPGVDRPGLTAADPTPPAPTPPGPHASQGLHQRQPRGQG